MKYTNSPRKSFKPTPKYKIWGQILYFGIGYRRLRRTWSAGPCRGIGPYRQLFMYC